MTTETDTLYSSLGEAEKYAKDLEAKLAETKSELTDTMGALMNLVDMTCDLVPDELGLESRPEMIAARATIELYRRKSAAT